MGKWDGLTSWAHSALTAEELRVLEERAAQLGVTLGAIYSQRHGEWVASASHGTRRVRLRGRGKLSAVLEACLQDYEQLLYTPEELLAIQRQSV